MSAIVVIGDERLRAGFRLTGVEVLQPADHELPVAFNQALARASLLVLTQHCADALPPGLLRAALARESPLVVVMPDIDTTDADTGFARRMRAVLGIES